jgi:spore germination protein YaaH
MRTQTLALVAALALAACTQHESSGTDIGGQPDAGVSPTQPPAPTTPPVDAAVPPQAAGARHARCGWIEYGNTAGYDDFAANATYFDVIHPDWYALNPDGVTLKAYAGADDSRVVMAARTNHVQIIPLIASVTSATYTETMMNSASNRAAHIAALVKLAVDHGYDGVDIDYEHLPEADRAAFTQFMTELAAAMHARGKLVSAAVYGEPHDSSVYDYAALAKVCDQLHIMGYDYHWIGGGHAGPVAPLGWVKAAAAHAAATGHANKFILGVPNYGLDGCRGKDCPAGCSGAISVTTNEMATCPYNVDDHYTAGRQPNCPAAAGGTLFFDDLQSLEEKVAAARAAGLGGVTYWAMGREIDGFFAMVLRYFPKP